MLNDEDDTILPPFPHDQADLFKLRSFEMEYQRDISLSTFFTDFDELAVEFKEGEDLVEQNAKSLKEALEA